MLLLLFNFFIFGRTGGLWKFLGQGLKPNHSCGNARSLTHRTTWELPRFHLKKYSFFFFFFLWSHAWHMEIPGPGCQSEQQLRPMPQPWQHWIRAASATYATAWSNARSLTHWGRQGLNPCPHRHCVGFLTHWATMGTPLNFENPWNNWSLVSPQKILKLKFYVYWTLIFFSHSFLSFCLAFFSLCLMRCRGD